MHSKTAQHLSWSPSSWQALVYGRSAALFGVPGGVSIALLSGGTRRLRGPVLSRAAVPAVVAGPPADRRLPGPVVVGVRPGGPGARPARPFVWPGRRAGDDTGARSGRHHGVRGKTADKESNKSAKEMAKSRLSGVRMRARPSLPTRRTAERCASSLTKDSIRPSHFLERDRRDRNACALPARRCDRRAARRPGGPPGSRGTTDLARRSNDRVRRGAGLGRGRHAGRARRRGDRRRSRLAVELAGWCTAGPPSSSRCSPGCRWRC